MMYEANEIQDVMGRSYGIGDDIDEAELEAEFDALGELRVHFIRLHKHTFLQTWVLPKMKLNIRYNTGISIRHIFIKNSGDDFLADNDSSFLDEIATPNAPTSNPGQEDTGETDEFGLPRIPETAK